MTAPRVSVVVPTHNRGPVLSRAIESVLAQSEQRFEILVVDDGSPNNEQLDIVTMYRDSRLHYSRLPTRRGPAAARNLGVRNAHAPYVAFLDDDDEWLPEKLAWQLAILDRAESHIGAVCTARYTVNQRTGTIEETRCSVADFDRPLFRNIITTSSMVVRRECFDKIGFFDEALEASSDYDMWLRLSRAYRIYYLDEALVRYFLHGGQISADFAKKARSTTRLLEKHAEVLSQDRKAFSRKHVALGISRGRSGDIRGAQRAFLKSIRLDPLGRSGYVCLALSFFGAKRFREVLEGRARYAEPDTSRTSARDAL